MCQALPARVLRVQGELAWVEGSDAPLSLLAVENVAPGDYVFYHAGLALGRVEPDEAELILDAMRELEALYES
jgi:hydrogenase assembly chaperone HypC/HupF